MNAYTLKKDKNTEELHLFEGDMTEVSKCNSGSKSICKEMEKLDSKINIFTCEKEDEARTKCAKIGRDVCGVCVSHLYTTYN